MYIWGIFHLVLHYVSLYFTFLWGDVVYPAPLGYSILLAIFTCETTRLQLRLSLQKKLVIFPDNVILFSVVNFCKKLNILLEA